MLELSLGTSVTLTFQKCGHKSIEDEIEKESKQLRMWVRKYVSGSIIAATISCNAIVGSAVSTLLFCLNQLGFCFGVVCNRYVSVVKCMIVASPDILLEKS
jgi:hypothetical protein